MLVSETKTGINGMRVKETESLVAWVFKNMDPDRLEAARMKFYDLHLVLPGSMTNEMEM
jgi:hypothetical protein